jgi:hypothetical protein
MHRFRLFPLLSFGTLCIRQSQSELSSATREIQQSTITTSSSTCIQDFRDIYDMESAITDTSVNRTYIICPNKLYKVGYLDDTFQNLRENQDGGPPVPLRSNMKIRCGNDGSSANLCYITGGHLQVDGTMMRGIKDTAMENVLIEGFVFINAYKYSFWATKHGSVTFRDCEWRVRGTHQSSFRISTICGRNPMFLTLFLPFASRTLPIIKVQSSCWIIMTQKMATRSWW